MIKIQNIYYMLAYAYQVLQEKGYASCGTEKFENTADLLSAILVKGVSKQVKRGLGRTYIEETEPLSSLRGKIDVNESLKQQTMIKHQLVCTYDEFSVDSYMNRILKSTMELLLRYDIPKTRKKEIRNLLMYFRDVKSIDVHTINWRFRFHRNNQSYQMLMAICNLIVKGLLQTTADGSMKLMHYLDEQRMCRLYEKFILEYYRKHYPQLNPASPQIKWALDDGVNMMLPTMQSDIVLEYKDKTLIIDAKYYAHTTQVQYDKHTLHSNNLYQIFTYVKNKAVLGGDVSGLLLYAKTDEDIQPNNTYMMSGNRISVKTLDLNCDFSEIAAQLNAIADEFINEKVIVSEQDKRKIHDFAVNWQEKFSDTASDYIELVEHHLGDECVALGFEMDCGNAFTEKYGKAAFDSRALGQVIDSVDDVMLLGSAIFSRWRYFNHWAYTGAEILEPQNIEWFNMALTRLKNLTA